MEGYCLGLATWPLQSAPKCFNSGLISQQCDKLGCLGHSVVTWLSPMMASQGDVDAAMQGALSACGNYSCCQEKGEAQGLIRSC